MITSILVGLIVSFLMGGSSSAFLTPNLIKRVKKSIKDATKKTTVLDDIKLANAAQARFNKRAKSYKSMLSSLTEERVVSRQEYNDLFSALIKDHQLLQKKIISTRSDIVALITPEEFALCIDKDFKPSEKSMKKATKALNSHLKQMKTTARKIVEDKDAIKEVSAAIDNFDKRSAELILEIGHMDIKDHEALGRYDATKKELKAIADEFNDHRKNLYVSFIDLHQALAKASTDKQWKAASKALKTMLK